MNGEILPTSMTLVASSANRAAYNVAAEPQLVLARVKVAVKQTFPVT